MSVITAKSSVFQTSDTSATTRWFFRPKGSVNDHSADRPKEMSVKNMHVIWQSAALYKSLAAEFHFNKKCEFGMPISIGSHVEVAAKAVVTLGAAQYICSLSGEAFHKTVT